MLGQLNVDTPTIYFHHAGDKVYACLDDANWERAIICGVHAGIPMQYNIITLTDQKVHERVDYSRIKARP